MNLSGVVSTRQLHALAESLADVDDRRRTMAELIAVVEEGRLADNSDAAFALAQATELAIAEGDLEHALRLAERAVEAEVDDAPRDGFVESVRAAVLFRLGRNDEALAALETVRPALLVESAAVETIVGALREGDQLAIAEEWLTTAASVIVPRINRIVLENAEEIDPELSMLGFALLTERYELRRDLELPLDDMDRMAEVFAEDLGADFGPAGSGTVAFFPQGELEGLISRWPDLAEVIGATWDDHRLRVESALVVMSDNGGIGLGVVPASAEAFVASLGEEDDDLADAVIEYLEELEEPVIAWPPERNAACWCGSATKYKKCCLPRSRV